MSKSQIFVIILIVLTLIAGGVAFYFVLKPKEATTSQASSNFANLNTVPSATQSPTLLTHTDTAGFTFKYPSSFSLKDITPEDDITYSFLTLSKEQDKIVIKIEDTEYKTLSDWEKDNTVASLVGATNLSGLSAKEYKLGNKQVIVAVDKNIIYYLEYSGKDMNVFDSMLNSFAFVNPAQTGNTTANSDIIYEEEEVIE